MPRGKHVKQPTPLLAAAAAEQVWRQARRLTGQRGGGRRRNERGRVLLAGKPIGDAPTACAVLGIRPESIYSSLRRGFVVVAVPLTWERAAEPPKVREPKEKRERTVCKQVWSDRPGETWPSIGDAANALGCSRNAISGAVNGKSYTCAGRRWFTDPPEWARPEMAAAERRRCAGIRCHPGRFGRVVNGTDSRTGIVYTNGEPARESARLAKGAAA